MTNEHPPTMKTMFLPIVIILALVAGAMLLLKQVENRSASPEHIKLVLGQTLPDFELKPLLGDKVKLSKVLGEKLTLINFWATWCGPCVNEMPSIQKLKNEFEKRGLNVVGINTDENPEKVLEPFVQKLGLNFVSYVDPQSKLLDKLDVHGLPYTVIINKEMKVLYIQLGEQNWFSASMRKQVEQWLAE